MQVRYKAEIERRLRGSGKSEEQKINDPGLPATAGRLRIRRIWESRCRSSCFVSRLLPQALDPYPRGFTGHVAFPTRSIPAFLINYFG